MSWDKPLVFVGCSLLGEATSDPSLPVSSCQRWCWAERMELHAKVPPETQRKVVGKSSAITWKAVLGLVASPERPVHEIKRDVGEKRYPVWLTWHASYDTKSIDLFWTHQLISNFDVVEHNLEVFANRTCKRLMHWHDTLVCAQGSSLLDALQGPVLIVFTPWS